MDAQGKLYTAASMELAPTHSKRWLAAKAQMDSTKSRASNMGYDTYSVPLEFNKLMKEINQTYLTDTRGDICVSLHESYEDCMAKFQREGWEIKYDAIHYPTIN